MKFFLQIASSSSHNHRPPPPPPPPSYPNQVFVWMISSCRVNRTQCHWRLNPKRFICAKQRGLFSGPMDASQWTWPGIWSTTSGTSVFYSLFRFFFNSCFNSFFEDALRWLSRILPASPRHSGMAWLWFKKIFVSIFQWKMHKDCVSDARNGNELATSKR